MFRRAGKPLTDEQLDTILEENDLTGDGKIGFAEFKTMMVGTPLENVEPQFI